MNASELMAGDYARVNRDGLCIKKGSIVVIRGIDADDKLEGKGLVGGAHCHPLDEEQFDGGIWCDYLDPIPLTPEILEKNGFVTKDFFSELVDGKYRILSDGKHIAIIHGDHTDLDIPICFVHELQHAMGLCKIDKKIEL